MAERVLREGPAPLVETMSAATVRRDDAASSARTWSKRLRSVMMATDPRGIAAAARGMAERPDMTAALGQIRCPTLVIVGQEDAISPPAEMRGMAEAIPGGAVRRDSRRRPHVAAGESARSEHRDRCVLGRPVRRVTNARVGRPHHAGHGRWREAMLDYLWLAS